MCPVGMARLGSPESPVSHGAAHGPEESSGLPPPLFRIGGGGSSSHFQSDLSPLQGLGHPVCKPLAHKLPSSSTPCPLLEHQLPLSHLSCRLFPAARPDRLFAGPSCPVLPFVPQLVVSSRPVSVSVALYQALDAPGLGKRRLKAKDMQSLYPGTKSSLLEVGLEKSAWGGPGAGCPRCDHHLLRPAGDSMFFSGAPRGVRAGVPEGPPRPRTREGTCGSWARRETL